MWLGSVSWSKGATLLGGPLASRSGSNHLERTGTVGRRKQQIELLQLLDRQRTFQRESVFFKPLAASGFGDGNNAVLREQPRDGDLRGCHRMLLGKRRQCA